VDEKIDCPAQIVGPEGLGEEAVGAFGLSSTASVGIVVARDHKDCDVPAILGAAQLAKHFPAIDAGKPDVENHEIGVQVTSCRQAGSPVSPLIELPGGLAKTDLDDPLDHRRVLNYEDALVRIFSGGHDVYLILQVSALSEKRTESLDVAASI
jgi:hypothetical protein